MSFRNIHTQVHQNIFLNDKRLFNCMISAENFIIKIAWYVVYRFSKNRNLSWHANAINIYDRDMQIKESYLDYNNFNSLFTNCMLCIYCFYSRFWKWLSTLITIEFFLVPVIQRYIIAHKDSFRHWSVVIEKQTAHGTNYPPPPPPPPWAFLSPPPPPPFI